MRRVGILVFDGVTLLDVSGPVDVLHHADPGGQHYDVDLVSHSGGAVRTASGVTLADTLAADGTTAYDTVIIAGGPQLVQQNLDPGLLDTARQLSEGAQRVASVCTGAFVLAGLGYLDGRRATTHWRDTHLLARWYPRVIVEPDILHIQDGRYFTSAGITAGIDLALALVEHDLGADTAREVARELVMFMQRPGGQSQFSSALTGPVDSPSSLRRLMDTVVANPAAPHTVSSMAAEIGVSTRHLSRLFQAAVGVSPSQWVEQVRVDAARHLILAGHRITEVALRCGFGTDETLRHAFARQLGTTPTAFRQRFGTTLNSSQQCSGQEQAP